MLLARVLFLAMLSIVTAYLAGAEVFANPETQDNLENNPEVRRPQSLPVDVPKSQVESANPQAQVSKPTATADFSKPVSAEPPKSEVSPAPKRPAVSKEHAVELNVAKILGSLSLNGWTGRPLESFPKLVPAAAANAAGNVGVNAGVIAAANPVAPDITPANQLFGLEPQIYDILAEFKVRKCYKRVFQRGQRFLQAGVYFFASPDGAYGAYNYMRQGAATIVVRGTGSSEDDQSISFWKGNCFVRLTQSSEQDDESKEALSSIATSLDNSIPAYPLMPLVLNQLPVIDRVRGSEKLVMGPNSGRKFFPAPFIGMLSLDRARAAITADYRFQLPPERLKLLVVDYGNAALAGGVYQSYRDNLDAEHDAKDVSDAIKPTSLVKLDNGFMLVQLRGSRVFVIMGARKKVSPMMLARQIP